MSSTYTPVPVELGDITLIDDGDLKNAAGINTPVEAVADGVAFLTGKVPYFATTAYLATTLGIVVPPEATHCFYEMCGGGGQGGGAYIAAGSDRSDSGGGGGGGTILCRGIIEVIAGELIDANVGAGGSAAGVGGASASNGSSGSDSTIVRQTGTVTLATARGAAGGSQGTSDNASAYTATILATDEDVSTSPVYRVSNGGAPVRGPVSVRWRTFDMPISGTMRSTVPQAGGDSVSRRVTGSAGGASPQGFAGGAGGALGATSGSYLGGSGGGGGGAGPYGDGGLGGHGGNGNAGGSGATAVTAGTAAAANTGAGGGGGGAPGGSSTLTGNGGAGGAGGSGQIKLTFLRATS